MASPEGAGVEGPQNTLKALTALQRKALGNLEEKGIETLYLAMGMSTWPASDGGRPYDAPVLLLPASIKTRGRTGDDLRLSVAGEPQINPVLLHVLQEIYAVRIDSSSVLSECGSEDESDIGGLIQSVCLRGSSARVQPSRPSK